MKCPNCASTDVIKVQDQFFCVNCGNLVTPPQPKPAPIPVVALSLDGLPEGVTILPVSEGQAPVRAVKRRKPGRPKAAPMDLPNGHPLIAKFASEVAPDSPQVQTTGVNLESGDTTGEHRPTRHGKDQSGRPPAAKVMDVRPAPKEVKQPETPKHPHKVDSHPVPFNDVMSASVHGRFGPLHLGLSLFPAIIVSMAASFVVTLAVEDPAAASHLIPAGRLWPVAGEAIIIALIYYVSRSFAQGAIMYGAARQLDHRPVPLGRWLEISARSFGSRLRFDLLVGACLLATIAIMGGLLVCGGTYWGVPDWLQLGLLSFVYLALAYLATGLMIAQGLGHVAVTLATVTARQAFKVGWLFFRHHFELVGLKIVALFIELALIVPLIAGVTAIIILLPSKQPWLTVLGVGVAVGIAGTSIGAASALWWQAAYRRLVRTDRLTEAVGLLSGRKAGAGSKASSIMVAGLLMLAVLAAAWPWLPLP